jgi:hypothetical protein
MTPRCQGTKILTKEQLDRLGHYHKPDAKPEAEAEAEVKTCKTPQKP